MFALLFLGLLLSAWKWSSALRLHELQHPFGFLLKVLCIGFFFNTFLPTAVGGDLYRVYRTLPHEGYRSRALSAVLVDRATGLLALIALGAGAGIMLAERYAAARIYWWTLFVASAIGAVIGIALLRGWLKNIIARLRHRPAVGALLHHLTLLRRRVGGELPALVAGSFLFQLTSIGIIFVFFSALTDHVTFAKCALIAATVGVAAVLPVSINGIGVMEGAFVATAVALGLDFDQALVVALMRRLLASLLAVIGGALFLIETKGAAAGKWVRLVPDSLRGLDHGPVKSQNAAPLIRENGRMSARAKIVSAAVAPPDVTWQRKAEPSGEVIFGLQGSAPSPEAPWWHSELLEHTQDAIIIWEMEGAGILYWNQTAEHLYGYTREEAHGRVTHDLLRTATLKPVKEVESILARCGVWVGELRHTAKDGRIVEVEGRLSLMSQRNGRWLVLEVNRDMTDRTHAEATRAARETSLTSLMRAR